MSQGTGTILGLPGRAKVIPIAKDINERRVVDFIVTRSDSVVVAVELFKYDGSTWVPELPFARRKFWRSKNRTEGTQIIWTFSYANQFAQIVYRMTVFVFHIPWLLTHVNPSHYRTRGFVELQLTNMQTAITTYFDWRKTM